jgi:formamidopyrimidine-DNA glycosylase
LSSAGIERTLVVLKVMAPPGGSLLPELPEVESVARALRQHLLGRACTGLRVRFPGVVEPSAAGLRRAMLGRVLQEVHRHGKYLILTFAKPTPDGLPQVAADRPDDLTHVMLHLRMTGQVVLEAPSRDPHVHLECDFEGLPVCYRDVRKFGRWTVVDDAHHPARLAHVGPDMLDIRFDAWHDAVASRRAPFKAVLLDQGVAAGLGNIYADEALFRAGVHPLARPCDLPRETLREVLRCARAVLRLAIDHGGTTFLNFANFHGQPGGFRRKLRVYGRTGEPCRECRAPIERIVVGGRSTHFCPRCQADR